MDGAAVAATAAAAAIESELRAAGTPERATHEKAYLKSDLEFLGTSVPDIRRIATTYWRDHPGLDHDEVVSLVEALWAEEVHERRMACVELLDLYNEELDPADLPLLERLLRESRTWALVDGLASSVVGTVIDHHPEASDELDRWAADPDFWIRRAALLALLVPLRAGGGDFDRFSRYADALLEDEEFFVRKAIGWVLRDTARRRPELVAEWLLPRAARASRVTVREAVKRLDDDQREAILAAHRGDPPHP